MTPPIISLHDWLDTPPGQYLLAWEQAQFDLAVSNLFGFNALQLGLPELHALACNRMPHRWLALPEDHWDELASGGAAGVEAAESQPLTDRSPPDTSPPETNGLAKSVPNSSKLRVSLVADGAALPFPEASLDLVVLPHTLELSANPHQVLREVERVLVPEGRVVITGFNPASWWGLRQGRGRLMGRLGVSALGASSLYLPDAGDFIGSWRLRDWLRLLAFELETERFGCYRPPVRSEAWLQRTEWMDRVGARWWPILGSVYTVVAVKRVRGMRLLGPAWKPRRAQAAAPVPVANRH